MTKLEEIGKQMRDKLLVGNCYKSGNEYCTGSGDVISDGDNKGREPKDQSASSTVGTKFDIDCRAAMLASNCYKLGGCEYCTIPS